MLATVIVVNIFGSSEPLAENSEVEATLNID
jgi:hypothetical protein